ncbi:biotin/lipoyl-binding protein [Paenibacillus mucilaginosus]|uniref:Lipoyl-binding domain-containing protein n=1 Tax=Paenibacillus mucilaginosus (strain KNP414) TaxID=1036673 RepID=F8F7E6_PAEMK|nr:biotin/lipoyl-binding protein [Paenibacillus mucilaginosus]AEI45955.1 hypothetical protein KNP414_07451 [Paenibacillus mucilaginosus KNP414]MCG7216815.1 hypothetical protein [Paenibacillus mucilaginosus]WDM27304.1 hypothetical protein KCX80_33795 [Paenibacillus mucilaginosus]
MGLQYDVTTPFAGTIERIFVSPGDPVEEGGVLFALSAGGLTHAILAPVTGISGHMEVALGEYVISGMILTHIIEQAGEPEAEPEGEAP